MIRLKESVKRLHLGRAEPQDGPGPRPAFLGDDSSIDQTIRNHGAKEILARIPRSNTVRDMRFLTCAIAFSCILRLAPFANAQEPRQFTVNELVDKNIAAKGGAEAIQALKAVRVAGRLLVNSDQIELTYVQTKKRPDSVRVEATLQGLTLVQAYDGSQGWKISPFNGRKDPEKMSTDDIKSLIEDADIAGPLVDWKAKGSEVEYLGLEDVDGTMAHKLRVKRKNGDTAYVFLDPDHFLEIRIVSQRLEHGARIEVETDLGDYAKVGGVFLPFSFEAGRKGSTDKQKIIINKAEANLPVDDTVFQFPAASSK